MRPRNVLAFLVAALIVPSLAAATAIHSIQGDGSRSPLVGQTVTTTGVVTAVKASQTSGGFFIQEEEANVDGNPQTSEGVFVYLQNASTNPAIAVGNLLSVAGKVAEYSPSSDPNSPPLTEITGPTVELIATGKPLPPAVTIDASVLTASGGIGQLERFEGMRVHVGSIATVSPTGGYVTEAEATATSDGVFWGVMTGTSRPFREPGIQLPDPLPSGAPPNVPRFDANPEKIRVDSDALVGTAALNVTSGQTIDDITGVLDYGSRSYTILPESSLTTTSPQKSPRAVRAATADELTVATFNIERFFDTTDDAGVGDVALSTAGLSRRLSKASIVIREILRAPDVVALEEVENLSILQTLAARLSSDAATAGELDPQYTPYLVEGSDPGGIDVGFLVKTSRVDVIDVTQEGKGLTFVNPAGNTEVIHDRPPLILRGTLRSTGYRFTVIANHLRSLNDIDSATSGARVRAKRKAESEDIAQRVQQRQAGDPSDHILVVGDFNSYEFSDGWVDPIGTIKGSPVPADQVVLATADYVNPNLRDLVDSVPAAERYSYSFIGDAEVLDHVLVGSNVNASLEFARVNADFPEVFRSDAARPERLSDHDPAVAFVQTRIAVTGGPRRRGVAH